MFEFLANYDWNHGDVFISNRLILADWRFDHKNSSYELEQNLRNATSWSTAKGNWILYTPQNGQLHPTSFFLCIFIPCDNVFWFVSEPELGARLGEDDFIDFLLWHVVLRGFDAFLLHRCRILNEAMGSTKAKLFGQNDYLQRNRKVMRAVFAIFPLRFSAIVTNHVVSLCCIDNYYWNVNWFVIFTFCFQEDNDFNQHDRVCVNHFIEVFGLTVSTPLRAARARQFARSIQVCCILVTCFPLFFPIW